MKIGDEQKIEMKRTLLEASVGRVTISSHHLENVLKVILFSCLGVPDEEFVKEWEKVKTLGQIINELKKFGVFTDEQHQKLDSARNLRNTFTHRLSEIYVQGIHSGAMYDLIQDFEKMKLEIDEASQIAEKVHHELAVRGGVNVSEVKEKARDVVDIWEGA
jgi:hypothetical protein